MLPVFLVYENVQTYRTYVYIRMYTTSLGLGSEGMERFFVTAIPPQHVRHDEFAHKVRNILKVLGFFVNSQWYERALETFAGLRVGWLARSFYTVTMYEVRMYVSLRLITKANFLLHDDFDCMMNQVLLLQLHVAKLPRIFSFFFLV